MSKLSRHPPKIFIFFLCEIGSRKIIMLRVIALRAPYSHPPKQNCWFRGVHVPMEFYRKLVRKKKKTTNCTFASQAFSGGTYKKKLKNACFAFSAPICLVGKTGNGKKNSPSSRGARHIGPNESGPRAVRVSIRSHSHS